MSKASDLVRIRRTRKQRSKIFPVNTIVRMHAEDNVREHQVFYVLSDEHARANKLRGILPSKQNIALFDLFGLNDGFAVEHRFVFA